MMVVTLEHVELLDSIDAKDFFDRFKHTDGEHKGQWIGHRGSTFTQADKWAPLWWEFLEGCLDDLPKTLVAAMKNECIHRWTRIMLEDDVEFVRAIKNMATDYNMNPDDEDAHLEPKVKMVGSILCNRPSCNEIAKVQKEENGVLRYLCEECAK